MTVEAEETAEKVKVQPSLRRLGRRLEKLGSLLLDKANQNALESMPIETRQEIEDRLAQLEQTLAEYQDEALLVNQKSTISQRQAAREFKPGPVHLSILQFLNTYKFATTSHIERYLGISKAANRLRELEEINFVRSYRYEAEKGRASEKCWWLWYGGARLLSSILEAKVNYDHRLAQHPPSVDRIYFRTMEHEIRCQLEQAKGGWQLIEPQEFNRANPRAPEDTPTPQSYQLFLALDLAERQAIEAERQQGYDVSLRLKDYEDEVHLECLPFQVNHHVAFIPDTTLAALLILCPTDITPQFWRIRLEEYGDMVGHVKIYGVFYSRPQATSWLETLNKAGIMAVTIDMVSTLLTDLASPQGEDEEEENEETDGVEEELGEEE